MHALSDPANYSNTISGYVVSILLGILTTGFFADRAFQRRELSKQNESLGLLQSSQAILLAAMPITQARLDRHDDKLSLMEQGFSALRAEMDRHQNWHERHDNG